MEYVENIYCQQWPSKVSVLKYLELLQNTYKFHVVPRPRC